MQSVRDSSAIPASFKAGGHLPFVRVNSMGKKKEVPSLLWQHLSLPVWVGLLMAVAYAGLAWRVFGGQFQRNDTSDSIRLKGGTTPQAKMNLNGGTNSAPLASFSCPPSMWESSGNRTYIPLLDTSRWNETYQGPACDPAISDRVFRETSVPQEELLAFTPCMLFERIRGRRLWFIGDSQLNRFRQATSFFLRQYAATRMDVGGKLLNFSGIPQILTYEALPRIYRPVCIELIDNTRVCEVPLMKGDASRLPFMFEFLNRNFAGFPSDIVIFNYGAHFWTTNSTLADYLGKFALYRTAIKENGGLDMPLTVWADTLPRHFSTTTGEYRPGAGLEADRCRALPPSSQDDTGAHNAIAAPFVANMSDLHLKLWNLARPLHWGHFRIGDCTHYCRPGLPELEVYALYKLLRQNQIENTSSIASDVA